MYTKPGAVAEPPGVVSDTSPVAPESTIAIRSVGEYTVTDWAGRPPKDTAVAEVKLVQIGRAHV